MYGGIVRLVVRTKAVNVSIGIGSGASFGPVIAALRLEAVTTPAAVLDVGRLALLGRRGKRRRRSSRSEAGGERRQPKTMNTYASTALSLSAAASRH